MALFDPYWLYNDGYTNENDWILPRGGFNWITKHVEPDQDIDLHEIFPASFSYHTHAKNKKSVASGTYFAKYLREYQQRVIELFHH